MLTKNSEEYIFRFTRKKSKTKKIATLKIISKWYFRPFYPFWYHYLLLIKSSYVLSALRTTSF